MVNTANVFVFDTEDGTTLTTKAVISDYQSLIFGRKRDGVGAFSMTIRASSAYASALQVDYLVYITTRENSHESRVGVITAIEESQEENDDLITVTGMEAKGITYWRDLMPDSGSTHWVVSGPGEKCIRDTVLKYLGASAVASKKIDFINTVAYGALGANYELSERFSNMETVLEEVARSTDLWWYFGLDTTNKKLVLKISDGDDRTSSQTILPRAIFSHKFKTMGDATRIDDYEEYRNVCYVGGQGEELLREVVTVGTATGWNRREMFKDRRDLSVTASLETAGQNELDALAEVTSIDFTSIPTQLMIDRDFFLGDLVTVSVFGITEDKRVTEAVESWSSNSYECDLTFGKTSKSTQDMIKFSYSSVFRAVSI